MKSDGYQGFISIFGCYHVDHKVDHIVFIIGETNAMYMHMDHKTQNGHQEAVFGLFFTVNICLFITMSPQNKSLLFNLVSILISMRICHMNNV